MKNNRTALVFDADRIGYSIEQIADKALTVGELMAFLEDYNEDDLIILAHDRGYTYGTLDLWKVATYRESEDGEEWIEE